MYGVFLYGEDMFYLQTWVLTECQAFHSAGWFPGGYSVHQSVVQVSDIVEPTLCTQARAQNLIHLGHHFSVSST